MKQVLVYFIPHLLPTNFHPQSFPPIQVRRFFRYDVLGGKGPLVAVEYIHHIASDTIGRQTELRAGSLRRQAHFPEA